MQILSLILLFCAVIILMLQCGSMLFHLYSTLHKKRAPFVPSPRQMIDHLPAIVNLNETSVVYDLGCGEGRILRSLYRHFPLARYIGIENDFIPFLLARLLCLNIPSARFTIKRKNFFAEDITPATHIITYLFSEVMDQLLPKLEQELRPGTVLISFDFSFSHKKPDRIITSPALGRHTLFVYLF